MAETLEALRAELEQLKLKISRLENQLPPVLPTLPSLQNSKPLINGLSPSEYVRYGRQMIVPGFNSLKGQQRLKQSKVLVVGAGGLGSPALLYICGAGVGTLGIVDNDTVEVSNLHRQVIHTTDSVGMFKCDLAKRHLARLNPNVSLRTHPVRLSNENAFQIFEDYDLVVDCTDTPATRYLINDVCVLLNKPLVSGSGVKTDGQVTVLNFANGPCYRCLYPTPPRPESVSSCGDAGVLGPAIGLTGVSLATEVIKILCGHYQDGFQPFLAMYSAMPQQSMRSFKMRPRQSSCKVCGTHPVITRQKIRSAEVDYPAFCGSVLYAVGSDTSRISVETLRENMATEPQLLILDVRPKEQFEIAKLPNSINVDWSRTLAKADSIDQLLPKTFDKSNDKIVAVCRYGNDSRLATSKLRDLGFENAFDVVGGLRKWSQDIDPNFPVY